MGCPEAEGLGATERSEARHEFCLRAPQRASREHKAKETPAPLKLKNEIHKPASQPSASQPSGASEARDLPANFKKKLRCH